MKKLTALISTLALLLALCACTGQAAGTESESVSTEPVTASQAVSGGPEDTDEPVETASPAPTEESEGPTPSAEPSTDELMAIAIELSERRAPVSELYDAIGQPISSDYSPGCLEPDSEDGELIYDGFTVYTVRTASQEYVYDVL